LRHARALAADQGGQDEKRAGEEYLVTGSQGGAGRGPGCTGLGANVFGAETQWYRRVRDRSALALYSYAHVPWIKGNGQRGFDDSDLPQDSEKRALYEEAKKMLEAEGYIEIGMDHFALEHDDLAIAFKEKNLHRNFMGYTTQNTKFLLGLGMSAISDSWFGFAQNEKSTEKYIEIVNQGIIPIFRGHLLNEIDLEIRQYILDLMCHFETTFDSDSPNKELQTAIVNRLAGMVEDNLVVIENNQLTVTEAGIPFVRNCCMAFDQDLADSQQRENMFSKTI